MPRVGPHCCTVAGVATGILRDEVCGPARGQVIFATAPFISAAMAWAVLGDPVEVLQIVGVVLAAAGVGVSLRSGREHEQRHARLACDHEHVHGDDHHDRHHDDGFDGRHIQPRRHETLIHAHPTSPISTTATTTDPPNVVMSGTSHAARNMCGGRPRLGSTAARRQDYLNRTRRSGDRARTLTDLLCRSERLGVSAGTRNRSFRWCYDHGPLVTRALPRAR